MGGYRYASGTSMAAPHAAGLAGLLKAQNPSLTADQIRSAILTTGDDLPTDGKTTRSNKRINALKAMQSIDGVPTTTASPPSSTTLQPTTTPLPPSSTTLPPTTTELPPCPPTTTTVPPTSTT